MYLRWRGLSSLVEAARTAWSVVAVEESQKVAAALSSSFVVAVAAAASDAVEALVAMEIAAVEWEVEASALVYGA